MGANIKAIRARIKSVDSTRHITKAMELVASSKIKKASERMERSRFYKRVILDAFAGLASEDSMYAKQRSRSLPTLYIIVAGDRGLAGGYNNNIFRSAMTMLNEGDYILPIGKRSVDYYRNRKMFNLVTDEFISVEGFNGQNSAKAANMVKDMYDSGKISAVCLISTKFESMLSQSPELIRLLPLKDLASSRNVKDSKAVIEYEPSAEEVLAALIPEYISGILSTSVAEAYASELAARRSAMDTATKNADEMLDELNLNYNRARQGAITQEITEIVAGANA
ncbi:MAG: ATP synthase F1 subunit gamma [Clostridia bacterium]|nr:ATP synthase F1 subunit gamma [Clostridia bacterium]